jgi:hypothetical protein
MNTFTALSHRDSPGNQSTYPIKENSAYQQALMDRLDESWFGKDFKKPNNSIASSSSESEKDKDELESDEIWE